MLMEDSSIGGSDRTLYENDFLWWAKDDCCIGCVLRLICGECTGLLDKRLDLIGVVLLNLYNSSSLGPMIRKDLDD